MRYDTTRRYYGDFTPGRAMFSAESRFRLIPARTEARCSGRLLFDVDAGQGGCVTPGQVVS